MAKTLVDPESYFSGGHYESERGRRLLRDAVIQTEADLGSIDGEPIWIADVLVEPDGPSARVMAKRIVRALHEERLEATVRVIAVWVRDGRPARLAVDARHAPAFFPLDSGLVRGWLVTEQGKEVEIKVARTSRSIPPHYCRECSRGHPHLASVA